MNIIIIGGVAAGTSAAAKARRNDEQATIKIYEMDSDISYSACGTPYYIGGEIADIDALTPRDASFFKKKYRVDVLTQHEVLSIDREHKCLRVKNLLTHAVLDEHYDKLVIATGAKSIVPDIVGAKSENVFYLRNIQQAKQIKQFITTHQPKCAVIVGTGFIGLEMAENLKTLGIDVTIVERLPQVTPFLDADVAVHAQDYLEKKGFTLALGESVVALHGEPFVNQVVLQSGKVLDTDFVIMSIGATPNVSLAKETGVAIGVTGAILVNTKMQTNIADIYACGDCAEQYSVLTGKPLYRPLGSTANKTGRIAGDQITGGNLTFRGILGTSIFKVFDMTVAQTGLTEQEATKLGYKTIICHNIKPDRPPYFHGKEMVIKAVADKETGRLLGVQIVGYAGVDKRIDVFATAITFGALASDLSHLDLAYAPPFSTTKDPVIYTGMILDNALNRGRPLKDANDLENTLVIDARSQKDFDKGHVEGALHVPLEALREQAKTLDNTLPIVTYCNKGVTGNAAQNVLLNLGFQDTFNLSGGYKQYVKSKKSRNV
ncbi:MAG: FAD-dependent oxidoreductase [Hyphomonadaceae bacterium]|nr:FAD-dependent oxidoreductase [Clostridia bacterium]